MNAADSTSLHLELEAAVAAARAAGEITERYFGRDGDAMNTSQKAPDHPVTDADLASNVAIRKILSPFLERDGWLSEESADSPERLSRERIWVIDPIDGTKEFIAGIPEYVVSIGLCIRGEAVLGVILQPTRGELWTGTPHDGARLNGAPVAVRPTLPSHPSILVSRTESRKGYWDPHHASFETTACGSIAYKIARVASGETDGAVTLRPRSEWDIAAGAAILSAAGGVLTTHDGVAIRFNAEKPRTPTGVIAGNRIFIDFAVRALAIRR